MHRQRHRPHCFHRLLYQEICHFIFNASGSPMTAKSLTSIKMASLQGAARSASRRLLRQCESPSSFTGKNRFYLASPVSHPSNLRKLHSVPARKSQSATTAGEAQSKDPSNPALSFPCLDAQEEKSARLSARSLESGPEPSYTTGQHEQFHCKVPLLLDWGGVLP